MSEHPATDLIVAWWAERFQVAEKREAFAAALRHEVCSAWSAELAAAGDIPPDFTGIKLEVDYDPSAILLEAVQKVGIPCRGFMFSAQGIFPQKTRMRVEVKEVTVREGYGAPFVEIWRAS